MDVLSFSGSPSGLEAERGPACVSGAPAPRTLAERSDRGHPPASSTTAGDAGEKTFLELRRKVQLSELLSASTVKLLGELKFNGHLTVVVQHGRVIKSGYEEGYFRRTMSSAASSPTNQSEYCAGPSRPEKFPSRVPASRHHAADAESESGNASNCRDLRGPRS